MAKKNVSIQESETSDGERKGEKNEEWHLSLEISCRLTAYRCTVESLSPNDIHNFMCTGMRGQVGFVSI